MTDALKSNSFINDDKIFIASVNKNELEFNIYNLNSKKLLKNLSIKKDKDITFKNTPIKIYVGESEGNAREIEDTKKYLRKITADRFGVAALKNNNQYLLALGGYKLQTLQPYSGGMGFGGMPIASFGNATVFFNPTMFAYNSGSVSKSTKIECLFDENLNHIEGEIPKTSFDYIDVFLDRRNSNNEIIRPAKSTIAQRKNSSESEQEEKQDSFPDDDNNFYDIFHYKENVVLGSYDKSSKMYYFYKF